LSYEFIATLLEENTGTKGKKYLPFVFSIFLFVLVGNLLGLIPYSFTFTSQLILTFGLASLVFLVIVFVGIANHGAKFLQLFFPEGAPLFMAPLLVPIELISFLSRPVSLSVRLFANMMAGHTMLKVFALFTIIISSSFAPVLSAHVTLAPSGNARVTYGRNSCTPFADTARDLPVDILCLDLHHYK
ncbi:MAG: ATP synthase F0 subunit A, partial [Nitrososphaeria archaeon]|nr:ATP synthase F0 subunit A [Nitrososphaeria archaeon]